MNIAGAGTLGQAATGEAELLARAKARDPEVWARWHDELYPFVYRYAYSRLRSREDAEDIASQVFIEAIKGIQRYDSRGRPILAWFYGIAHNLVSRRFREGSHTTSLLEVEAVHSPRNEETLVESLQVRMAMDRLKPEHKEVLTLRFLLDLPTKQVAGMIGKTEAATYSLQVRAMEALRRELQG